MTKIWTTKTISRILTTKTISTEKTKNGKEHRA
jgi:hypothetical protein